MSEQRLRVFISSKMQELAAEREAIKAVLAELHVKAWVFEKDAGARPQTIQETYLEEVEAADLYIGLFWKGYGAYTIEEYEHAQMLGMDCLIYEKREDIPGHRDPELQTFLEQIGDVESGVTTIRSFNTPDDLREFVKEDVAVWQARIIREGKRFSSPAAYVGVPPMPTHFVGRSELVKKMVRQLRSKENLAVEGLPGVGKTTLAVALARHLGVRRSFKDGILWASLGPHVDVNRALTRWAEALEKDITHLTSEAERSQTIRDAIGQKRMLIVIDDVWDLVPANVLRCGGPNCCHLLTTRDKAIARAFVDSSRAESLPTLDDDRAYQLLQALASEACAAYPNAVRSLVQAVGGLPLAIRLIGGYLAAPEHSMFGDFFPDLSEEALSEMANPQKRLQLAQERLGVISDEKTTLQDTITLSLEGLPDSVKMAFYALGAFASKPERFSRKAAKAVTQAASAILALLAARNLLEVEEEGRQLTVHQTVADVARTQLDEAAIVRHRDYYLNQVNEDKENWQRIEAVYGQIEWAWHQAPTDKNLLDFIWALRPYQNNRGLWRISLDWANRGLRVAHGKDKVELLIRIGSIYGSQEQHDKAKDYHQRAERFVEKVNDQAAKADFLNSKGVSYFSRGQYALALDHLERALQNTEASDQGKLGGTLNLLGLTYQKLNQWRTALDYYQQSVQALEKAGDRRDRAITLSNIGLLYQNLGQSERALEHYRQAVSIQEEIGDLTGECITRYNIATIYRENGRLAKSVAELSRVVEIDRLTEDPDLESDSALLAQVEEELATQE